MSSVRTLSMAPLRGAALVAALMLLLMAAACGGQMFGKVYEYEEDLYVSLDGSAELIVNASIPALVTLRGLDLPLDPGVRLDTDRDSIGVHVAADGGDACQPPLASPGATLRAGPSSREGHSPAL